MMSVLSRCLNWRVLVGLAAVAATILVVAPHLALSVFLPVLLVAACPLALLWMWKSTEGMPGLPEPAGRAAGPVGAEVVTRDAAPGRPGRPKDHHAGPR